MEVKEVVEAIEVLWKRQERYISKEYLCELWTFDKPSDDLLNQEKNQY